MTDANEPGWRLRRATMADVDALDALMKQSIRDIFPAFYDAGQTSSSEQYVGVPDRMLIEDGTYFVIEEEHQLIACGGWSRRDKLYTGSGEGVSDARQLDPAKEPARVRAMFVRGDRTRRGLGTAILKACETAARAEGFRTMALMATLPGVQLYQRFGFVPTGPAADVRLPDGVLIACVPMERPVSSSS